MLLAAFCLKIKVICCKVFGSAQRLLGMGLCVYQPASSYLFLGSSRANGRSWPRWKPWTEGQLNVKHIYFLKFHFFWNLHFLSMRTKIVPICGHTPKCINCEMIKALLHFLFNDGHLFPSGPNGRCRHARKTWSSWSTRKHWTAWKARRTWPCRHKGWKRFRKFGELLLFRIYTLLC